MVKGLGSKQFKTGVVFSMTKMKNVFKRVRNRDLKLLPNRNRSIH